MTFLLLLPGGLLLGLTVLASVFNPGRTSTIAAILVGVGFILFLVPKLHAIRRRALVSWGSGAMSRNHRRAYRTGYALMAVGVGLALLVLLGPVATAQP